MSATGPPLDSRKALQGNIIQKNISSGLNFGGELDPMMHEIGHELNSKLGSVLGENWKKPFSK